MKQLTKITLYYNDNSFQEIVVPSQCAFLPTVFTGEKQLLQEVSGIDPTRKSYEEVMQQTPTAWIPRDSAAEKALSENYWMATKEIPQNVKVPPVPPSVAKQYLREEVARQMEGVHKAFDPVWPFPK